MPPAPSEPAPSEPAPSEPAPSEPAPSEPAPSEPAPSEPAPSEPAPSESAAPGRPSIAGLRERKKEATREALSMAALRLALERGIANVRVGDIAAAAGVSPRTYNNYFSNREQAICALGAQRALLIVSALNERPASEALAEALVHAMVDRNDAQSEPDKDVFRLMMCDEVVRGEWFKATAAIHRPFADAIAARVGMGTAIDLLPNIVASTYEAQPGRPCCSGCAQSARSRTPASCATP